jgi:hypothetical protein
VIFVAGGAFSAAFARWKSCETRFRDDSGAAST